MKQIKRMPWCRDPYRESVSVASKYQMRHCFLQACETSLACNLRQYNLDVAVPEPSQAREVFCETLDTHRYFYDTLERLSV